MNQILISKFKIIFIIISLITLFFAFIIGISDENLIINDFGQLKTINDDQSNYLIDMIFRFMKLAVHFLIIFIFDEN
jgi:hypothetical protein